MKKFKKIIPALCMLLVSAVLLGSSTYAWFSLNNKVTVTGMQVSTKVDNNLLIADSTEGTVKAAENAFGNALNQSVNGELQPASTVDGVNFFYTNEAKANGEAIKKSYSAVSDNKITIGSKDYQAYAQQVFELKAINTSARDVYVKLSTLNLLYNGSAVTVEQAYRVAVFCQELATGGNAYKAFGTAANSIFTIDGATNFTRGEAVNSTTTTAAVTYGTKFFKSVSANSTAYYKITVRMWLEGEDTTCNNTTFMSLTGKWTLDLMFTLDKNSEPSTAVTNIGTEANATLTKAEGSNTLTAELTKTGENADSYAWYKVGETAAISGETNATYTPSAGTYYCEITTVKGNVYRTPNVIVA
ncbi:MAG: hypothetical protein SOV55_06130 [Candidatus Borkfalkiaceae bacterium]|nr:hypothetical protein [Christensenellaceae bacterium]